MVTFWSISSRSQTSSSGIGILRLEKTGIIISPALGISMSVVLNSSSKTALRSSMHLSKVMWALNPVNREELIQWRISSCSRINYHLFTKNRKYDHGCEHSSKAVDHSAYNGVSEAIVPHGIIRTKSNQSSECQTEGKEYLSSSFQPYFRIQEFMPLELWKRILTLKSFFFIGSSMSNPNRVQLTTLIGDSSCPIREPRKNIWQFHITRSKLGKWLHKRSLPTLFSLWSKFWVKSQNYWGSFITAISIHLHLPFYTD